MNQGSIPVSRASSSGLAPLLSEAIKPQRRRSLGSSGKRSFQLGSSQSRDLAPVSRERTAFWIAASKQRSMAITSPVAFIWVPRLRSPEANLSNGQRGILTTQ